MFSFQSRRSSSVGGLRLTMLFAVPFAIIGSCLAYRTAWTVVSAKIMQAWPTIPATLSAVELKAEGNNSEKAVAAYTYVVNGQQYSGKRVSLYGADNLGSFQKNTFEELQGYASRNAPYPAHVNPKNPNESVLLPVIRWEAISFSLIFVVLFCGAGWGLLITSYFAIKRIAAEAKLAAQFPNEPWRQKIVWTDGRIKSDQESSALGAIVIAIMWNVCSWPLLFALPEKIKTGEYVGLLLLIFPIIGLGVIYWAVVSVARARRFGETYLELETFPGRQGEDFRGRVLAPEALGACQNIKLVLTCEKNFRVSSTRGGSENRTQQVWRNEAMSAIVRGQSPSGGVIFKVNFSIPAALPDSSDDRNEWFTWQLSTNAELPGADFEAEFEVPVFKRA
jgi:hypothetical protein